MNQEQVKDEIEECGYGEVDSVIATAKILHDGWEMDNDAWVVKMQDGSIKAFTTNHGSLCEWSKESARRDMQEALDSAESIRLALEKYL